MTENSPEVQAQLAKLDDLTTPVAGQITSDEVRMCDACGCLFVITNEDGSYLWVDRYIPASNGWHEECNCHGLAHVEPEN